MHFCISLKDAGIPIKKSTALTNLFANQIRKIEKSLASLHEDLQYDYIKAFEQLKVN